MKTWMKKSLLGIVALFGLAAPSVASARERYVAPVVHVQPVGYFRGGARGGYHREPRWERRADFRRERRFDRFGRNHYRRF